LLFTEIDLQGWPRGQMFVYFSQMAPTGYSMTVQLDITDFWARLKRSGRKFFPTYLWAVTACLNRQPEFKIAYRDGKLGYYDTLTPLYAHFHRDDKTFSLMWTEYSDDYNTFYEAYLHNQQIYGDNRGILSQSQTPPPENAYTVSCIPWVSFTAFSVHSYQDKPYFFPSVEAGKIVSTAEGRKLLPLSLTCHHATTDGCHIQLFLEDLKKLLDTLPL